MLVDFSKCRRSLALFSGLPLTRKVIVRHTALLTHLYRLRQTQFTTIIETEASQQRTISIT